MTAVLNLGPFGQRKEGQKTLDSKCNSSFSVCVRLKNCAKIFAEIKDQNFVFLKLPGNILHSESCSNTGNVRIVMLGNV